MTLCVLGLLLFTAHDLKAAAFEIPGNAKASEILPADMISGPHYRVREKVVSQGFMYQFTVDSTFGVFEVTGQGALRKLLKEIRAIAILRKVAQTEAYGDSLRDAAEKPLRFGQGMVTDPGKTATDLSKGVFQILSNAYTSMTNKRNPAQDSAVEEFLALSAYKRQYAHQLGVDVYSSNAVLQKELTRVGWASVAGSTSFSIAMMPLAVVGTVVSYSRLGEQINEMIREQPPSRLRQLNEQRLSDMGIVKDAIQNFLDHPSFSPRQATIITASLSTLTHARGRSSFLRFTFRATGEASANFFVNIAETMRGYSHGVSPIQEVKVISDLVLARAENGSVLIPFPVDHIVWTEWLDRVVRTAIEGYPSSDVKSSPEFTLWVTGTVSPLAKKNLEERGIKVTEHIDQKIEFMD